MGCVDFNWADGHLDMVQYADSTLGGNYEPGILNTNPVCPKSSATAPIINLNIPGVTQYAGVPAPGYTPAEWAALADGQKELATQIGITSGGAAQLNPDGTIAADVAAAAAAPSQTGTSTGWGALYDLISPYIVPIVAGLVVTVIVILLTGSSRPRRTGRRANV